MTIRELLVNHLENNGLFESDAKTIIADLEAHPACKTMNGRWDHGATEYPDPLLRMLVSLADEQAVKWIDATCPNHWARPMFAGGDPR